MPKQIFALKLLLAATCIASSTAYTQSVNVGTVKDNFKKSNLVKVNGGISANTILYNGNGNVGRNPFDYFLNGNVNINLFNIINLPFSFNLTNSAHGFRYPTMPNRLSVHPTYKWITGHIGDVNMTFSPYTLNGHQFTGAGFDFTPVGKWSGSVMYGRLNQAVAYDSTSPYMQAAYKRMGYGAKMEYAGENYRIGFITFAAKDDASSLQVKPDSLEIYPQKNLAVSWNVAYRPIRNIELTAEYATSAITSDERDTTSTSQKGKSYINFLVKDNGTTAYYHAIKGHLNYSFGKSIIGFGYERVDPGYQTLGAYFFNNDLENITINYTRSFLKDKANIAGSFGYQHDDLDGLKSGSNKRTVGSLNLNYNPSEKIAASFSYSSFTTHLFIKPQFQQINQLISFQNLDTLNFSQISQNANLNLNYQLAKSTTNTQSINLNLSFFDASDKQGGIVRKGNTSQFYNLAAAYNVFIIPANLSITTALNGFYNTVGRDEFITLGPTLAANAQLFKKKIVAGLSSSYNVSMLSGTRQATVLNSRLNASYAYHKRHFLSLGVIHQSRDVQNKAHSHDLVTTLGYNVRF